MKLIKTTSLLGILSLLMVGLFSSGCALTKPASASFASVTITGKSPQQIQDATIAVFREDGYRALTYPQGLVFEKEGSKANSIGREGFTGTYYGAVTIIRVRVQLVEAGPDSHRLQCQACMVSSAGDSFFEDEHPLTKLRSAPYQSLLNQVARRLK